MALTSAPWRPDQIEHRKPVVVANDGLAVDQARAIESGYGRAIRAVCNDGAEAPAGKVAEAPPSH
jgi:hypothetical protein